MLEVYEAFITDIIIPNEGDDPADWTEESRDKFRIWSKLERVERCKDSLEEFAIEYFTDAKNAGNDGNWDGFDAESADDLADFHKKLTDMMNRVSSRKKNAKVAAAIARSHGKSTWLSKGFPVKEIAYRRRRYIILISETPTVAKANMEWIRNQFKMNAKLREDFGPLLSPRDQANITDNGEEFIAWHPDGNGGKKQLALVQAASTGQALRGRNWNAMRPDLIIMDDLEDARPGGNASTPEQRQKLRDWFSQTVMPLGDPKGKKTAFVMMGTTVHISSLLMHVLYDRSDFETQIYRAIIEPPKRMDLWEECRLIYTDRENKNRLEDAEAFYQAHFEEMNEGAKVLWEEVQSLWTLMTWKWNNGSLAFNTEYMNNPIDEETQVFNPDSFVYHDGNIDTLSDRYDVSMGIDFAMGKTRGDYSAITVTARDKSTGIIYVVDSFAERVSPTEFMDVIVRKVLEFQPTVIGAEAQMAQEYFVDELKKALTKVGYPAETRVKKIYQRNRKELRIEAMLPSIENGTIRFNRRHAILLEQFERYGTKEHDDAIDSLEISVSSLGSTQISVQTVRTADRWSQQGGHMRLRR